MVHPGRVFESVASLVVVTLVAILWSAPGPSRAQELRDPVEEAAPSAADVVGAVLKPFSLQGRVLDQLDRPAAGLTVAVPDSGNRTTTDSEGRFALPAPVRATDRLRLEGEDFAPRRVVAGSVWAGQEDSTGEALLRVVRLTESFEVGPDGGRHDGEVGFEVPPGALTGTVRVRAARVPRALTWSEGPGIQPQPLAGVDLEPAGLELRRPIRVFLPLPPDMPEELDEPVVELLDPATGRYRPVEDASAAVEGNRLVLTVQHFSGYRVGNPAEGVERRLVETTNDLNGDGHLSAEDADFVLVIQGGAHEASWAEATTMASSVLRSAGWAAQTSEEESRSLSGGVSFGGVGVEVGSQVAEETAHEVLEKLGLSATTERSEELEVGPLEVPEYERRCLYLLRIYDIWDVSLWRRVEMSQGARDRFHVPEDSEWHYYDHEGDSIMMSDRSVYAGRYAARWKDGRREIYLQTDRVLVREPTGTMDYRCSTDLPVEPKDLWRGGESLAQADVFALPDGSRMSVEYGGWGVLPTTRPLRYLHKECGGPPVHETLTVRRGVEETTDAEITDSVRRRDAQSVSLTAEIELPGGVGLSGGADWERAVSRSRSFSRSYGTSLVRQVETTIRYGILTPHKHHESDHELYRLHLLHTVRFWKPLPANEVPRELEGLGGSGQSGPAFADLGDDRYAMHTADDQWFVSGPPITTTKEAGLYLVRVAERFCGPLQDQTVPLETPTEGGGAETPSEEGGGETETPSGGGTQTPGEQGARTVPEGSRVVLTGTVVADEPAFGTALSPDGIRLTGVVVDLGGEKHVTDDEGRVTYTPPSGAETVTATFPDGEGTEPSRARVVPRPRDLDPSAPPEIDDGPQWVLPGDRVVFKGGPFDGEAGGTGVTVGGADAPVLASSPTEVVVGTDPSAPLGEQEVVVTTDAGESAPFVVTFLQLSLEASARHLIRGQKATATLRVSGTEEPLCIRVTNETPAIISLKGGETVSRKTRGGTDNSLKLKFTGVSPGDFALGAEVVGEAGEGCGGD